MVLSPSLWSCAKLERRYLVRVVPVPWSMSFPHLMLMITEPINYSQQAIPRVLRQYQKFIIQMVLSVGLSFCLTCLFNGYWSVFLKKGWHKKLVLTRFSPCFQKITRLDILENPSPPHTNLHGAVHEVFFHPFCQSAECFKKLLPHLNVIVVAPQVTMFSYQLVIGLKIENRKSLPYYFFIN